MNAQRTSNSGTSDRGTFSKSSLPSYVMALVLAAEALVVMTPAAAHEECYLYTPYAYQKMGGNSRLGPYSSWLSCNSIDDSYFHEKGNCSCETIDDPAPSSSVQSSNSSPNYNTSGTSGRYDANENSADRKDEEEWFRQMNARRQASAQIAPAAPTGSQSATTQPSPSQAPSAQPAPIQPVTAKPPQPKVGSESAD